MQHRHLAGAPGTPVQELGRAAVDDLLDRGDLDDWAPLASSIAQDPWSPLADMILELVDAHPLYGTSTLWRRWIGQLRYRRPRPAGSLTVRIDAPAGPVALRFDGEERRESS